MHQTIPRLRCLSLLLAVLGGGCTFQQEQPVLDGQDIRLTILHTADIHSRLLPYDLQPLTTDVNLGLSPDAPPYGGIGRLAALIARERKRTPRAIHVDSGDCFQGAPIFNGHLGEVEIKWLSLIGADAVVVGNHEFDAGAWNLYRQVAAHATYPLLAANYDWRDPAESPTVPPLREVTEPYTIVNADGLKVAIIGMANISSLNSIVAEGNSTGAVALEQNEVLRQWVGFLHPQVDLIVVVSHLGLHEDIELVTGYETVAKMDVGMRFATREYDAWELREDHGDGTGTFFVPGVRGLDVIMGGHLHVVLNPPQIVVDRDGREVVLSHSGAFAKYLGRLDLVLHQDPDRPAFGWEVKMHTYKAFPIDGMWCIDPTQRPQPRFGERDQYLAQVRNVVDQCRGREHTETMKLLEPYVLSLNQSLDLPRIFAYAPRTIQRRNSSTGGDAPLGNITADAMRRRRRVSAEIGITNTLGIRDALYAGPINIESMFNVFPFENTLTVMYLSGTEIQEVLDFVTYRSAGRGCQSQAQVAGLRFVMDCGQVLANEHRYPCNAPSDCPNYDPTDQDGIAWSCREGECWAHPAKDILVNGEPLDPNFFYKVATNNYIAGGGSGFTMLKRNTTQFDTGVAMRDALIDFFQNYCTCRELLSETTTMDDGSLRCNGLPTDEIALRACETIRDDPDSASAGKCSCGEVAQAEAAGVSETPECGYITDAMRAFCADPMDVPIIVGIEDGRIVRRIVDRSQL